MLTIIEKNYIYHSPHHIFFLENFATESKKQCVKLVIKEGYTISNIQREFDLGNM